MPVTSIHPPRKGLLCFLARNRAGTGTARTVGHVSPDNVPPVIAAERTPEQHRAWVAAFAAGAVVVAAQTSRLQEPARVAAAFVLAAVPFLGIILFTHLLQYRVTRPLGAKRWALLWGALVATGGSSYANGILGGEPGWATIVVVAPIVEELTKFLGLLLLLHWGRIRSSLDGVVYALIIGGGFALVENTFYFFNAISAEISGDDGVLREVFLMRGIASPLAHPFFVGFAAAAMGAWRTGPRRGPLLVAGGWVLGVLLHALWNHAALAGMLEGAGPVVAPVFLLAATTAVILAVRERQPADAGDGSVGTGVVPVSGDGRSDLHWSVALPWYPALTSLTDAPGAAPSDGPVSAGTATNDAGNTREREPS